MSGFPRLYAAASLKLGIGGFFTAGVVGFPRLYAAASLKHAHSPRGSTCNPTFSAALCRGLIEATCPDKVVQRQGAFSAALCRGLIEAMSADRSCPPTTRCFPRLYAAASLKPGNRKDPQTRELRFPRLYAAASLKHPGSMNHGMNVTSVFRGFMPRPH